MPPLMKRLPVYAAILAGIFGYQWWRAQQPREIVIELAQGGVMRLDGQPVQLDTLTEDLRKARERSPKLPVVVRADPQLPAGALLPVVAKVEAAGATPQFETAPRR